MSVANKNRPLAFPAALILACCAVSPASARPSMWWDHFESAAASQAECVSRAGTILAAEKAGQLASDVDSVRAWSEKSVAVTECIRFGDKLIVSVMVSSDDAVAGNTLYNAVKGGMAKK